MKKYSTNKLNYLMGMNQLKTNDLVEILGVNQTTVNSWIRGENIPNDENKKKLADVFECRVSDIFTKKRTYSSKPYQSKTNVIGRNIRHYRTLNKLTQAELGKKINVQQKTVCEYEMGKYKISEEIQNKLINVFGITKKQLLGNSYENHSDVSYINHSKTSNYDRIIKDFDELKIQQKTLEVKIESLEAKNESLKNELELLKTKVSDDKKSKKSWFF